MDIKDLLAIMRSYFIKWEYQHTFINPNHPTVLIRTYRFYYRKTDIATKLLLKYKQKNSQCIKYIATKQLKNVVSNCLYRVPIEKKIYFKTKSRCHNVLQKVILILPYWYQEKYLYKIVRYFDSICYLKRGQREEFSHLLAKYFLTYCIMTVILVLLVGPFSKISTKKIA